MTAQTLLEDLRARGVQLVVEGQRLRARPRTALSPEIDRQIRDHKPALVALLRGEASQRARLKDGLGGVHQAPASPTPEQVAAMGLADFAAAGLLVEVYSETLGERVLFASDNATVDPHEERTVYRAAELRELLSLDAEGLRQVHRVKTLFNGTVEAS